MGVEGVYTQFGLNNIYEYGSESGAVPPSASPAENEGTPIIHTPKQPISSPIPHEYPPIDYPKLEKPSSESAPTPKHKSRIHTIHAIAKRIFLFSFSMLAGLSGLFALGFTGFIGGMAARSTTPFWAKVCLVVSAELYPTTLLITSISATVLIAASILKCIKKDS